jgi:solute carrier family 12 sodium/potassium/chloride transporter 2
MYLLGFAETVVSLVGEEIISSAWDERLLAFFTLLFCMLICMIGVSWVVKIEKFLLITLLGAIVVFVLGAVTGPVAGASNGVLPFAVRNLGPKWSGEPPWNFDEVFTNTSRTCSQSASDELRDLYGTVDFGVLLAVFFPAVCGILAGANISGDLKDPSTAIPNGTLLAIVFTTIVYVLLSAVVGFVGARTSIESFEEIDGSSLLNCEYGGMGFNYLIMAESSLYPPLVFAGIFSATVSSALGAFVGAPRILQSLARDRLFTVLTPLGKGYGKDDEPLRAYAVTFLIAFVCILTGELNSVAPLITTFFLASYALVNYACFAADTAQAPGWRPSFRFFTPWLALSGAVACVGAMLMLSAIMGFITFVLGLGLYKYIEVTNRGAAAAMSQWYVCVYLCVCALFLHIYVSMYLCNYVSM